MEIPNKLTKMKYKYKKSKFFFRLNALIIMIAASLVIYEEIRVYKLQKEHKFQLEKLIALEARGLITGLRDIKRGRYLIEVELPSKIKEILNLPIGWDVKKSNIEIGDSLSIDKKIELSIFIKFKMTQLIFT